MAFIQDHGGRLYVWADEDGLKHVKLHPPDHAVEFRQLDYSGFEFNVDATIADATWWQVKLHHFPHKYIDALWDGWEPAVWSS